MVENPVLSDYILKDSDLALSLTTKIALYFQKLPFSIEDETDPMVGEFATYLEFINHLMETCLSKRLTDDLSTYILNDFFNGIISSRFTQGNKVIMDWVLHYTIIMLRKLRNTSLSVSFAKWLASNQEVWKNFIECLNDNVKALELVYLLISTNNHSIIQALIIDQFRGNLDFTGFTIAPDIFVCLFPFNVLPKNMDESI